MPDRVVCVIQARQGSSRLPGKSLRPLQGRPLISHVIERARAIPGLSGVILATTGRTEDDGLALCAQELGIPVFRGSEADVLDRMTRAADLLAAYTVIRVTGDCPFLDPAIAASVLQLYRSGWDYAWNDTAHSGFPDGTDVEVFSFHTLRRANEQATTNRDREHVTTWIRNNSSGATLANAVDYSWMKLSVDTMVDYDRAVLLASRLERGNFSLDATLAAYNQMDMDTYKRWRT